MDIPASPDGSFDSYDRLLRLLIPSLHGMSLHDGYANLIWASPEWSVGEGARFVMDSIANALVDPDPHPAVSTSIDADRTVYAFALRGTGSDLLGVVSLAVGLAGRQTSARPLSYVRNMVLPALDCLARDLRLRAAISARSAPAAAAVAPAVATASTTAVVIPESGVAPAVPAAGVQPADAGLRERDLLMMLDMSSQRVAADSDAGEFDLILKTGVEHQGCALAALWVPDKKISMSLTRSGQPMASTTLQLAERHLMEWMKLQQRTIVVNRIAKAASRAAAPYKILACPIRHTSERVLGVLAFFNPPSAADFDAHQTRLAELLAKRATFIVQSHYDAATGLMTRHAFERQARVILESGAPSSVHGILYLDIDRLHVVNETFGMHVGDEVIAGVAACLAGALPAGSLSARISGDRLAALIPDTSLRAATALGETVREAAAKIAMHPGHGSFDVSVSIGVAPISGTEQSLAHALATAEVACKAAKDRGRNRTETFQDSDQSIVRRHTDIMVVGQLRSALEDDRFQLDAQPILSLRGARGHPHFELLLRMLGDRGEVIPPGKFLPAADRYQLMPSIDRWVVRSACERLGRYRQLIGAENARFAINLSGQSLQDATFLDYVIEQIKSNFVEAGALCFELTETATIGNLHNAQAFMRRLQALGCRFSLDDFGTGVSSLAYLKDLSVDYLKIDGSFVRDVLHNPRSESMIKAIAQLAKSMNMETIAEYVETDALRTRVAALGVDYGQGFAMGRSRRFDELLRELALFEATVNSKVLPTDEYPGAPGDETAAQTA